MLGRICRTLQVAGLLNVRRYLCVTGSCALRSCATRCVTAELTVSSHLQVITSTHKLTYGHCLRKKNQNMSKHCVSISVLQRDHPEFFKGLEEHWDKLQAKREQSAVAATVTKKQKIALEADVSFSAVNNCVFQTVRTAIEKTRAIPDFKLACAATMSTTLLDQYSVAADRYKEARLLEGPIFLGLEEVTGEGGTSEDIARQFEAKLNDLGAEITKRVLIVDKPFSHKRFGTQQINCMAINGGWWDSLGDDFKFLNRAAADVLSKPISASACEFKWSDVGHVVNKRSQRLSDDKIEKKVNIRAMHKLNDMLDDLFDSLVQAAIDESENGGDDFADPNADLAPDSSDDEHYDVVAENEEPLYELDGKRNDGMERDMMLRIKLVTLEARATFSRRVEHCSARS
ncbi:MAG: hypothetical protein SGPRY_002193, partial [Prymnesium sp.]